MEATARKISLDLEITYDEAFNVCQALEGFCVNNKDRGSHVQAKANVNSLLKILMDKFEFGFRVYD